MGHRDRTFVSYASEDISFYWAMRTWREREGIAFDFHDAHDLAMARGVAPSELRRRLRERIGATRQVVVLVGARSRALAEHRLGFFAQEIDVIRGLRRPVIYANLNGSREVDGLRLPLALADAPSISVPFAPRILQHALDDFTPLVYPPRGSFLYPPEVYAELGL